MRFVNAVKYIIFLAVAFTAAFYFTQIHFALIRELDSGRTDEIMLGVAKTPYQYRVLIPWIVNILTARPPIRGIPLPEILFWCETVSVILLLAAFRRYLCFFFSKDSASILSFSLYAALYFNFPLTFFAGLRYPSDIPAILFFTLGLILLYGEKWLLYYPLFVLGTLNRETTCFLVFVYLFAYMGRRPLKTIAIHCLIQTALWFSIKYALFQLYRTNPGDGLLERHFWFNVWFFKGEFRLYPFFLSTLGFTWVPCIFYFRRIRERFVRRSLLVIFPFFAAMMYAGNIFEIRTHAELLPITLTACLIILRELEKQ